MFNSKLKEEFSRLSEKHFFMKKIWKESLNSNGQQHRQYQQNKQLPLVYKACVDATYIIYIFYKYIVKPVIRGHLWDKKKVTL